MYSVALSFFAFLMSGMEALHVDTLRKHHHTSIKQHQNDYSTHHAETAVFSEVQTEMDSMRALRRASSERLAHEQLMNMLDEEQEIKKNQYRVSQCSNPKVVERRDPTAMVRLILNWAYLYYLK